MLMTLTQIFGLLCKIVGLNIYDEDLARFVFGYPRFVVFIQSAQIIQPEVVFIFTASFLDLADQSRNGSTKVDQQVGEIRPVSVLKISV